MTKKTAHHHRTKAVHTKTSNPHTRHHKHEARVIFSNLIMVLSVVTIVSILVLATMGYTITNQSGSLGIIQNGFIQFSSNPTGANILIDDKRIFAKTPNGSTVSPGQHFVTITREGYDAWHRTVHVESGRVLWLDYALLLPQVKNSTIIKTYDQPIISSFSDNAQYLVTISDELSYKLQIVELTSDDTKTQDIRRDLFTDIDSKGTKHSFSFVDWNYDNNKLLVRHQYGDSQEWILINARNLNDSINLTRAYRLPLTSVGFMSKNGNQLYVLENGNLRRADINGKNISAVLADNVEKFSVANTGAVVYVSVPDANKAVYVNVYVDGERSPSTAYSPDKPIGTISVAGGEYFREDYVAVAEDRKLTIIKGDFSTLGKKSASDKTTTKIFDLDFPIEHLEMSANKRFVMAVGKEQVFNYDLEFDVGSAFTLDGDHLSTEPIYWLNAGVIYTTRDGKLVIYDYNGENRREVLDTISSSPVALTQNSRYLYYIAEEPSNCSCVGTNDCAQDCDYPPVTLRRLDMLAK